VSLKGLEHPVSLLKFERSTDFALGDSSGPANVGSASEVVEGD
jgi:hypothetical protein